MFFYHLWTEAINLRGQVFPVFLHGKVENANAEDMGQSDAGIPLRHIQEISGHRTLAALERYLGVTEKQKQNAISALDF